MFRFPWRRYVDQVLFPKADEEAIQAELRKVRSKAGPPVLWLLGKTQSGKSSIVEGLTGSDDVEIGSGWQACTRTGRVYDFPNEQESLIRFLDTRGIGEPNYDPAEDLAWAESQAHGVLVVMRACDPAQEIIKRVVAEVRKRKPGWPIVLVQTCLHEGYPRGQEHPVPYRLDRLSAPSADSADSALPVNSASLVDVDSRSRPDTSPSTVAPAIPAELLRSLAYQREQFAGLFDRSVAIDFTQPEDDYEPRFYGIDALWDALEQVMPTGFRSLLADQRELTVGFSDTLFKTALPHILSYSTLAGVAAAVPIPGANLSGVLVAQTKMLHSIASIYNMPLASGLKAIGPAVGTSFLIRGAGRSLLAAVPFVGAGLTGAMTASATFALGCVLCWYFARVKQGVVPTTEQIKQAYAEHLAQGGERFHAYFRGDKPSASNGTTTGPGAPHAT